MTYYGGKELADSFRTVRKNTLITAEEMPEEHYNFKAAPEVRTVAAMLLPARPWRFWARSDRRGTLPVSAILHDLVADSRGNLYTAEGR